MTFFFHLGICLSVWLCVGCIVGLKTLYIDGAHREYEENLKRMIKEREQENREIGVKIAKILLKSKFSWIAICSLFGFVMLYWDWTNAGK